MKMRIKLTQYFLLTLLALTSFFVACKSQPKLSVSSATFPDSSMTLTQIFENERISCASYPFGAISLLANELPYSWGAPMPMDDECTEIERFNDVVNTATKEIYQLTETTPRVKSTSMFTNDVSLHPLDICIRNHNKAKSRVDLSNITIHNRLPSNSHYEIFFGSTPKDHNFNFNGYLMLYDRVSSKGYTINVYEKNYIGGESGRVRETTFAIDSEGTIHIFEIEACCEADRWFREIVQIEISGDSINVHPKTALNGFLPFGCNHGEIYPSNDTVIDSRMHEDENNHCQVFEKPTLSEIFSFIHSTSPLDSNIIIKKYEFIDNGCLTPKTLPQIGKLNLGNIRYALPGFGPYECFYSLWQNDEARKMTERDSLYTSECGYLILYDRSKRFAKVLKVYMCTHQNFETKTLYFQVDTDFSVHLYEQIWSTQYIGSRSSEVIKTFRYTILPEIHLDDR